MLTESARALRDRLDPKKCDDTTEIRRVLCETLKVSDQTLWTWKTGNRRPEPHHRKAIEVLLPEISADGWETTEERAIVKRAERKAAGA